MKIGRFQLKFPRWAKVIIIILACLVIFILALKFSGWFDAVSLDYVENGNNLFNERLYQNALGEYNVALSFKELDGKTAYLAYIGKARIYFAKGIYNDAIFQVENALKYDKKGIEAYILLGGIYLKKDQNQEALDAFSKAIEIDNENIEAIFGFAKAKMRVDGPNDGSNKRFADILAMGNSSGECVFSCPTDYTIQAHLYLFLSYLWEDDFKKAQEEFEILEKLNGGAVKNINETKFNYEGIEDINGIKADFEKIKSLKSETRDENPSIAYKDVLTAWIYLKLSEEDLALQKAQKAILMVENYRDAWILKAYLEIKKDEFDGAEDSLKKAYEIDPTYGQIQYLYGKIYFSRGEFDKEIESIDKAINLGYDTTDLRYDLALVYEEKGNYEKAEEELIKSLSIEYSEKAQEELLWLYYDFLGDASKGISSAFQYEKKAHSANSAGFVALGYYQKNDLESARSYLKKALERDKFNALAYFVKGLIDKNKEDFERAVDFDFGGKVSRLAEEKLR